MRISSIVPVEALSGEYISASKVGGAPVSLKFALLVKGALDVTFGLDSYKV